MVTDKVNCGIAVEVLKAHGVREVVVSPGSRNAPLILAFDAEETIRKTVVVDERCAAFMALGMAEVSGKPVALVCTSGTALLNYAPAVAEAYYSGMPLIVVTADRPERAIDQDDSQTIRQPGALANIVKQTCDLSDISAGDFKGANYIARKCNDIMLTALRPKRGPVHINVRLDEPLTRRGTRVATPKIIRELRGEDMVNKEAVKTLAEQCADKRVLILGGFAAADHKLNKALSRLSQLPNVHLMAETLSNLHTGERYWAIDSVLASATEEEMKELRPDVVLTFGGALVSRMVKEWLRGMSDEVENWYVGHSHTTVDCLDSLTLRISADPARFFSMFGAYLAKQKPADDYHRLWTEGVEKSIERHEEYVAAAPWSDMKAFDIILRHLRGETNLQLSNGTPVRYAQLCLRKMPHSCRCNRGVSGIDGSTSTAVGAAMAYDGPTLLISGDLSFSYDIGALANLRLAPRLKIIVVNNSGGGIFRFIRTTNGLEQREQYFCAPPLLPLKELAESYGIEYLSAGSAKELKEAMRKLFDATDATILEVTVPAEEGSETLRNYFRNR